MIAEGGGGGEEEEVGEGGERWLIDLLASPHVKRPYIRGQCKWVHGR